jgi:hypothetical protein
MKIPYKSKFFAREKSLSWQKKLLVGACLLPSVYFGFKTGCFTCRNNITMGIEWYENSAFYIFLGVTIFCIIERITKKKDETNND